MDLHFLRSLLVAAAVHLLLAGATVWLARVAGVDLRAVAQRAGAPRRNIEIDILDPAGAATLQVRPGPAATSALGQALHAAAEPAERRAKVGSAPAVALASSLAPGPAAGQPGESDTTEADGVDVAAAGGDGEPTIPSGATRGDGARQVPRGLGALGLNRDMTWMWVNPKAVEGRPNPAPASTSGGLHEALDARDREMGLGFGGPVVSVMHAAALSTEAPVTGDAVLEASFDATGRVQAVQVLTVGGNMAGWERLARDVRRMLAPRRLRVPRASRGVAVTVQVAARYQLPSGSASGDAVQMQGAGAQFDVSDIGAVAARSVSVRILSERRL